MAVFSVDEISLVGVNAMVYNLKSQGIFLEMKSKMKMLIYPKTV
jgi:hypothetical protein